MKDKTKKILYEILKIIWISLGILIALITSLVYFRMNSLNEAGVIGLVILFSIGIYLICIYIGTTLLFLLIKWVIKKLRKK